MSSAWWSPDARSIPYHEGDPIPPGYLRVPKHMGYVFKKPIGDFVKEGNWICCACYEIWDKPTHHDCSWVPHVLRRMSTRARKFYEWAQANGYVGSDESRVAGRAGA